VYVRLYSLTEEGWGGHIPCSSHTTYRAISVLRISTFHGSHQHTEAEKVAEFGKGNLAIAVSIENPHELRKEKLEQAKMTRQRRRYVKTNRETLAAFTLTIK